MKGLRHEDYTLDEIYNRDSGICGICNKQIIRPHKVRNMMATIDHILPIALGGDDIKMNVQVAHLSCNARKAHRV